MLLYLVVLPTVQGLPEELVALSVCYYLFLPRHITKTTITITITLPIEIIWMIIVDICGPVDGLVGVVLLVGDAVVEEVVSVVVVEEVSVVVVVVVVVVVDDVVVVVVGVCVLSYMNTIVRGL